MICKEIVKLRKDSRYYPKLLSQIPDPPGLLYCRGNLNLLNQTCLAVVGTRKLTSYGKEATQYVVKDLVSSFVIVSGLAIGIDAIAHQTTLDFGGKTIAVLGSGIDDAGIAPKTNFKLAMDILKNDGLLISEYESDKEVYPSNFAARDRIISGLSKGVLIVEAGEKSGALITAQCALDQNRDVFSVPGSIFSSKSIGSDNLIKKGAKPVTSAQDILEEYESNPELFSSNSIAISTKNPVEKKILDILDENGTVNLDYIIASSKLDTSSVLSTLSVMEIHGRVKNLGNGKYKKS